ncbi:unnamed protein product [Dibothriocephalus latus]|uniref:Uncharacterized protein n=1 Tax=Dibothriocephalus latus TaxID=60516 RepID=A0A3P7QPE2_DIBLA|nr:unnamed protein product [Dibothriocephalus latus]
MKWTLTVSTLRSIGLGRCTSSGRSPRIPTVSSSTIICVIVGWTISPKLPPIPQR